MATRDMGHLVVLSPQWLCHDVIGSVLMPDRFCGSAVDRERRLQDQRDGVVQTSELRRVFGDHTEAVVRVLQHMEVCVVGDMEGRYEHGDMMMTPTTHVTSRPCELCA